MPVCPKCGTYSEDTHNFCTECGYKFIKPSAGADPSAEPSQTDQSAWQEKYSRYRPDYSRYDYKIDRPSYTVPDSDRAADDSGKVISIVSLVFGILGFVLCFFPPFSITGLVTGIIGIAKSGRTTAKIGLIISVISLALFTIALIITAINGFDFSMLKRFNILNMIQSVD